jgi:hypothetical protein
MSIQHVHQLQQASAVNEAVPKAVMQSRAGGFLRILWVTPTAAGN